MLTWGHFVTFRFLWIVFRNNVCRLLKHLGLKGNESSREVGVK